MRMIAYEYTAAIGAQERGILLPWNFLKLCYFPCALKSLPLARARVLPFAKGEIPCNNAPTNRGANKKLYIKHLVYIMLIVQSKHLNRRHNYGKIKKHSPW